MASGQMGTELKFFFHCQLADKSGFYMIEGNPTMAHLWEYSRTAFFLYKTGLTNICLTLCVAGIHLRWVRHALRGIACFYSWLAGSHIGLYLYYHAPETLVVWI